MGSHFNKKLKFWDRDFQVNFLIKGKGEGGSNIQLYPSPAQ